MKTEMEESLLKTMLHLRESAFSFTSKKSDEIMGLTDSMIIKVLKEIDKELDKELK